MENKKKYYVVIILLLLILIGVGYAALSTTLNIAGTSGISKNTWNVHFENVAVTSGSVTAVKDATIDNNTTNLSYEIKLVKPGDFYEFTVDIKNAGSIDAMISEVLKSGLTQEQANYISYTLSYVDGTDLSVKDRLSSRDIETVIVRVEFKTDITADQLPNTAQELNLELNITYVQADTTAKVVSSFGTHSWDQIVKNVKVGNTNHYQLGSTKEVDMGDLGIHTVRVANKSIPAECSTDGFSQSTCGFVLEFADIITIHNMNSATEKYSNGYNIGGWPASEMRTHIQNVVYPTLPMELRNGIIDTIVVSGHGSDDSTDFTSTDKLYLLSAKEVWGIATLDTAATKTRQSDYYRSIGVALDNSDGAIKKMNSSNSDWFLRSPRSNLNYTFDYVSDDGSWHNFHANSDSGVSLAFRIG